MNLTPQNKRFIEILEERRNARINIPQSRVTSKILTHERSNLEQIALKRSTIYEGSQSQLAHKFYDYVQNNLILSPEQDIKLGRREIINLNDNGLEKLECTEEGYSSCLLFTFLAALLPKSSVLYLGEPGTGKTTVPETVANVLFGIPISKIQEATIYGNPELSNSDMLVYTDLVQLVARGIEIVHPRSFMTSFIRIIDEVNRIPPSKLSILYQVADRGFVTYKNKRIQAPPGPLFATANFKDSGNYDLPRPFIDRFDISLRTSHLNPAYINFVNSKRLKRNDSEKLDLLKIYSEISRIKWSSDASSRLVYFLSEINYCNFGSRDVERKTKGNLGSKKPGELCDECDHYSSENSICNKTVEGVSVRTYKSIDKFAKAFAWWLGKSEISSQELRSVLPYVLSHKLTPTKHAEDPIYANDGIAFIQDIYDKSSASYENAVQNAPIIQNIAQIVMGAYANNEVNFTKQEIANMLTNNISKINSPAKFGLAVTLYDLMRRAHD